MPSMKIDVDRAFERDRSVMTSYMESSKSFVQIASAGLGLTFTFSGSSQRFPMESASLKVFLVTLLVTIGSGVLYQYYAAKYLEIRHLPEKSMVIFPKWLANRPGALFGMMLWSFCAAALIFTISAFRHL